MAITATFRFLIRLLHEKQLLVRSGRLLEIGEANWYGTIDRAELQKEIERFVEDQARRVELLKRVDKVLENPGPRTAFEIVKVYYDIFFSPTETMAIDFGGTVEALRLDLNQPVNLPHKFDVVMNHGTAEHIFRVAQVFRTVHHYTAPGGLMIHEGPFTGWIDHGFYNLLPRLFIEVAQHNQYQLLGMFVVDLTTQAMIQIDRHEDISVVVQQKRLPKNANLFTAMRKGPMDVPFRCPARSTRAGGANTDRPRFLQEPR